MDSALEIYLEFFFFYLQNVRISGQTYMFYILFILFGLVATPGSAGSEGQGVT